MCICAFKSPKKIVLDVGDVLPYTKHDHCTCGPCHAFPKWQVGRQMCGNSKLMLSLNVMGREKKNWILTLLQSNDLNSFDECGAIDIAFK
jgi:hypothetical protein